MSGGGVGDFDEFRSTYFEECAELLIELEEQFSAIAAGAPAGERINAAFRAVHSIKGGGGAFGFAGLVDFAHAYETLLGDLRDRRVALTDPVIALCIRANDVIADHVAAARAGGELGAERGASERAEFAALIKGGQLDPDGFGFDPLPARVADKDDPAFDLDSFMPAPMALERGTFEIRFSPHPELYARANDPLLLLRELASLGDLTVTAVLDRLPPLPDFDPFGVYCSWEATLVSATATEQDIREVFEFVEGICDLSISELVALPEPGTIDRADPMGDLMPGFSAVVANLVPPARTPVVESPPEPIVADVPVEPVGPEPLHAPVVSNGAESTEPRSEVHSIRVDLEKVDRVVNMVGELVITQSMLAQQMDDTLRGRYPDLIRGLEILAATTRGLQDSVMAIRAQPVKSVFSRMPRLIRELAQKTGKALRLETSGEATEIDKTVIEQLADPLTHMVRNAADHGVETPEQRRLLGKPEQGTIRLSAEQSGSNIVVAVEDDGPGINRARVLAVARERGLVAPDAQLGDEQIDALIFAPGFSTADLVSDISGRGVGMDVVLSNVRRIGGSVSVRSWPGRGTRVTLRMPLTLAVVEVMLVRVAGSPYVVPLSSIVETVEAARAGFSRSPGGGRLLRLRGEYVRVIDLAERFGLARVGGTEARFVVLCETDGAERVALLVEDIVGQQQVVIKSLEQNFEHIEGISGGTILGDGSVALILDVQALGAVQERRAA